jgi:hypothetical protein
MPQFNLTGEEAHQRQNSALTLRRAFPKITFLKGILVKNGRAE